MALDFGPVVTARVAREPNGPFVLDSHPQLMWEVRTDSPRWLQEWADIRVDRGGGGEVFRVWGADQNHPWPFAPLAPRESAVVAVRVRGGDGVMSAWSTPVELLSGVLAPGEWQARFISPAPSGSGPASHPAILRGEFEVERHISRATLYATAQGAYQVSINGKEVDDHVLKPGWTAYQYRLLYETTDVTQLLAVGRNTVEIELAGGWFTESYSDMGPGAPFYGTSPSAAAQLVLDFADGTSETVCTGTEWLSTTSGPRLSSGIYAGESFDARKHPVATDLWGPVQVLDVGFEPTPRTGPPVRRIEEIAVSEITRSPSGALILDFGQNLVGRLRITVSGERGDTIYLRHAEVLQEGKLATEPLRLAAATDTYILRGNGAETWEPSFTFHGFRYAEITGWPGEFDLTAVVAVVVHSDMQRTGWFESSSDLLNRLHANAVWGMRGNFLSIPTDCPQRDERFGWTGDIQIFSPAATYLYDCFDFLSSWLEDLRLEQHAAGGIVPFIVPDVLGGGSAPIAGWGDAATVVPWALYERFGAFEMLQESFSSMCDWLDTVERTCAPEYLWETGFQFGDWLDPDAPADDPGRSKTDNGIVSTAQFFRSATILHRAATILGHTERAARTATLARRVQCAFLDAYVTPAGRMVSDSPTAYALAIAYGLIEDPELLQRAGDRLRSLVRSAGYRIGTGFIGTPVLLDALTMTGHLEAAERLLTQTENPSWLYPVTMGATTIWERWDSLLEDGTVNPGEMTSFNHYAFGSVVDWMHRTVGGLAPATHGSSRWAIAPHPLATLNHAGVRYQSSLGIVEVRWHRNPDSTIQVTASIPPGSMADVMLPGHVKSFEIGSGHHEWTVDGPTLQQVDDIGPQSSLAAIIDDPEAYAVVVAAIATHDPAAARVFQRRTKWVESRVLIDDYTELAPHLKEAVSSAIDNLARSRAERNGS